VNEETLIGIEPSAILTFRDEYIDLAYDDQFDAAKELAKCFLIDEFIAGEIENGSISKAVHERAATGEITWALPAKAPSSMACKNVISSENYKVDVIPSGCCTWRVRSVTKRHMKYREDRRIGFIACKPKASRCTIAAAGTSCRHQVDGAGERLHPVEILA
jgi:Fe-S oxidoreductase